MGDSYSKLGGEEEDIHSLWENLKERDHWKDTEAGGRLILKLILEKQK
jgi:hypothetical protein